MKTRSVCTLLLAASFSTTCSLTSAFAQTVTVVHGQKVLIDANGHVVPFRPSNAQPPSAPLVGGADSCVTPDLITGLGAFSFDNTVATTGAEGQSEGLCLAYGVTGIDNDVWFTWTSPYTGSLKIDTCAGGFVDSKIAAYAGNTCPVAGTALACNDDFCGLQSQITIPVTSGTSYVIQVGNYPGATGVVGVLTLTQPPPPPVNDSCATPTTLVGTGMFPYDTTSATTGTEGQNESLCNQFGVIGIADDLWFTWTATFTGAARVTNCGGTTGDTKFAAYAGSGCPVSGTAIACNDQACQSSASQIDFPVTQGNVYTLQIGDYPFGVAGPGTLTVQAAPPPPVNDGCTSPSLIVGTGTFVFDTTNATTGAEGQSESLCSTFGVTGIDTDVWYRWTATFSGTARMSLCGQTTVDTKVAAYAGTSCPTSGSALACNDNACTNGESQIDFAVTAGSSYILQIGNSPGTLFGPGTFTINQYFPVPVDDCQLPLMLGGPGTYPFDSSVATDGFQPSTSCAAAHKDLWYTYMATMGGSATITTCGLVTSTNQDTVIAIFAGTGCPTAPSIACDDDSCSTLNSTVTWNTVCGQTYTIQVGAYNNTYLVTGSFNITETGTQCGPTGVPFCFGDGTGTACPCGNSGATGNGCASSVSPGGANLTTSGFSSLANDTLVLQGTSMPNSSCLYFQGTTQISTAFGDGLRCAGGTVVRLGTKTNVAGASQYPGAGNPSVSVRGAVMAPGTRTYQTWYRNAAGFCTPSTFNLTNGVLITWQ